MPTRPRRTDPRSLRTLFNLGAIGDLTDGQLLERFATRDGESAELAFAALVERHGGLVLRACRSVLRDPNDAQDAFQATFLVLSRRADSLWVRDSIGPWLLAVALRVSRRSRAADARRRRLEHRAAELSPRRTADSPPDPDPLEAALIEELDLLPARFRDPIVLCDLRGSTYEQASRHLGLPVGTLKSRLARGRDRLGDRLRRRGFSPALAAPLADPSPGLPGSLIDLTSSAALRAAAGLPTAGAVPASALVLASGALWMMRLDALIRWSAAALAIALAGTGLAAATGTLPGRDEPPPHAAPARADGPAPLPAPPPRDPGPMISYEVRFIEVPGLALRPTGIDFDFVTDPPMGIAFLSDPEANLLLDAIASIRDATVTQAPKVSSFPGAGAVVSFGTDFDVHDLLDSPRRPIAVSGAGDPPPEGAARRDPSGRPAEGGAIRVGGTPSEDWRYLTMDIAIREVHVVATHTLDAVDAGRDPSRSKIEVPEVVRTHFDQRVTMPAESGNLLIGLGLRRTVDDDGESSLTDRYVLLRARPILPNPARPPSAPAAVPLPAPSVDEPGVPH